MVVSLEKELHVLQNLPGNTQAHTLQALSLSRQIDKLRVLGDGENNRLQRTNLILSGVSAIWGSRAGLNMKIIFVAFVKNKLSFHLKKHLLSALADLANLKFCTTRH